MKEGFLDRDILRRIAMAVVRAEVERLRGAAAPALPGGGWPDETGIGEEGLGLDSLERFGALGALAETFLLDEAALPERPAERVGDWIDWIERSRPGGAETLAVKTSGSTGEPKTCLHRVEDLAGEAAHFASLVPECRRVVALVPAHHLYGLIWTVFLPASLGIPVVDRALGAPLGLLAGDLVVAVPAQWEAILRLTRSVPAGCIAVSSAGPLPDPQAADLRDAGFSRVFDVYGSSETGAIAWRDGPAAGYALLPRWDLVAEGDDWQLADRQSALFPLPDHIERLAPRRVRPLGRRDGAVKVGGHTVWPEKVAAILRTTRGVTDVAVRLGSNGRLKAFIVSEVGPVSLQKELERVAAERLSVAERPKAYRFGEALPRNSMGKLADWV